MYVLPNSWFNLIALDSQILATAYRWPHDRELQDIYVWVADFGFSLPKVWVAEYSLEAQRMGLIQALFMWHFSLRINQYQTLATNQSAVSSLNKSASDMSHRQTEQVVSHHVIIMTGQLITWFISAVNWNSVHRKLVWPFCLCFPETIRWLGISPMDLAGTTGFSADR